MQYFVILFRALAKSILVLWKMQQFVIALQNLK
jgi:hypothetical protein